MSESAPVRSPLDGIADEELQFCIMSAQFHANVLCSGMAQDVGQCFLNDAKASGIELCREF